MFSQWLIRVHDEGAYIYKRKYWMNLYAVPWAFSGAAIQVITPDFDRNVLTSALECILAQDEYASIQIDFKFRS